MRTTANLHRKQRRTATIDDYASEVKRIWPKDIERPVLYQWLGVVLHGSTLAEEVRKCAWNNVLHEIAEIFVWWLSFVNRLNTPIPDHEPGRELAEHILSDSVFHFQCTASDIIWYKFPNVCPVCFGRLLSQRLKIKHTSGKFDYDVKNGTLTQVYNDLMKEEFCTCLARKAWVETRSPVFKNFVKRHITKLAEMKRNDDDRPKSLAELEERLCQIFSPSVAVLSAEEIAFHLLEEIGEASEALANLYRQPAEGKSHQTVISEHKRRAKSLAEELADIFSWLVTMREKTYGILNCASDYVERSDVEKKSTKFVRSLLKSASSIVELLWVTYAGKEGDYLRCEECRELICNSNHRRHKNNSGQLFGNAIDPYFEEFKALKIYRQ